MEPRAVFQGAKSDWKQRNVAEEKERRKWQTQKRTHRKQDLNQLLKVRREKLADLQEGGKDPFVITKYDVTPHSRMSKRTLRSWRERRYHRRTYDVQARDGKGILLQYSGFTGKYSVLCGKRQHRRRSL